MSSHSSLINSASTTFDESVVFVRQIQLLSISTHLPRWKEKSNRELVECNYLSVGFDSCSISGSGVCLRGHLSLGCLGSHCLRWVCSVFWTKLKIKLKKTGSELIQPQGQLRILRWNAEKCRVFFFLHTADTFPSAAPVKRLVTPLERDPLNSTLVERNASTYSRFEAPPTGGTRCRLSQSAVGPLSPGQSSLIVPALKEDPQQGNQLCSTDFSVL